MTVSGKMYVYVTNPNDATTYVSSSRKTELTTGDNAKDALWLPSGEELIYITNDPEFDYKNYKITSENVIANIFRKNVAGLWYLRSPRVNASQKGYVYCITPMGTGGMMSEAGGTVGIRPAFEI